MSKRLQELSAWIEAAVIGTVMLALGIAYLFSRA
jgi:hypothetical protein